ncbi:tetratricopeptide repeat protein [Candidatus Dependentiae bacterium]|nr:tetratricopeptide repeat protein [Candidatus Dependentiae bacterium]
MKLLYYWMAVLVLPAFGFAEHWRAARALEHGDYATAQQHWSALIAHNPEDVVALHGLATVAYGQERYADAAKLLDTVIAQSPASDELERALSDRAACRAKMQQLQEADKDLTRLLTINPHNRKAALNKRALALAMQEKKQSPQQQQSERSQQKQESQQPSTQQSSAQQPSAQQQQSSSQASSGQETAPQQQSGSQQAQALPQENVGSGDDRSQSEQVSGAQRAEQAHEGAEGQSGKEEQEQRRSRRGYGRRHRQQAGQQQEKNNETPGLAQAVQDERLNKEQRELLQMIATDEQTVQRHAIAQRAVKVADDETARW